MPNLFDNLPEDLAEEVVDVLVSRDGVRIERIISDGHASPDGFWYDQQDHEWVVVLHGSAVVEFRDDDTVHLNCGDWLDIPAHRKHRVVATSDEDKTIWLAVFFPADSYSRS